MCEIPEEELDMCHLQVNFLFSMTVELEGQAMH